MTFLKGKRLLSLLLVLVLVVSAFPLSALAAEAVDEHVCTCGKCTHDHCEEESCQGEECKEACTCEECEELTEPIEPVKENGLIWEVDEYGNLSVIITGPVSVFTSDDDQPWAAYRNVIRYAYVQDESGLTADSIAYWFSGCTVLSYVEIPGNVAEIGYHAFYNCRNLRNIILLHDNAPALTQGAFKTLNPMNWETDNDPTPHITVYSEETFNAVCAYDWGADNCPITVSNANEAVPGLLKAAPLLPASSGTGYCYHCQTTCAYTVGYDDWTDDVHCIRHWCSNCGYDQCGGVNAGNHVYNNNGYCTYCGHYNSAYDNSICYHTSTYTTWSGCTWYEYCRDCGQLMNSGVSHSYSFGSWQYYNTSRHSRTGTCTVCGATTTSYGYHSTTTKYSPYSSTQHSYGSYCSLCASYVGTVSYASHSFTYGSWQSYNGTQHRRLKTCSACGYSEYEYATHALSYGSWSNISATQHQRTVGCATCGYSTTETASHNLTYGAWTNYSATQHRRTVICSTCAYSSYEYAAHTLINGAWSSVSDTQHQRTKTCSCWYSTTENGTHTDTDNDGVCDACGYVMARFSVTVPASLSLVVSETGEVFSANSAVIINNSTDTVEVTAVTVTTANGWTLAPFTANMANAKVDTKLIGFSLNGAGTSGSGTTEDLAFPGARTISKNGTLPLAYDAVVSAMSEPVSEQVLTVVFVLDWAS